MGVWADWQARRARRQRVAVYLNHLLRDPDPDVLEWLASLTGDRELSWRELTYARRAIGLIVAERDALDDRTAADVAHQLAPVLSAEAVRDAIVGVDWPVRWRAYTASLAVRGTPESPAVRLARVLLEGAGVHEPSAEVLSRATGYVQELRASLNGQLRAAFGDATLPDDVPPSALRPGTVRG